MSTQQETVINTFTDMTTVAAERELDDPFEVGQLVTFDYSKADHMYPSQRERHGTTWVISEESWVEKQTAPDGKGFVYTRRYRVVLPERDEGHVTDAKWLVPAESFDEERSIYEKGSEAQ